MRWRDSSNISADELQNIAIKSFSDEKKIIVENQEQIIQRIDKYIQSKEDTIVRSIPDYLNKNYDSSSGNYYTHRNSKDFYNYFSVINKKDALSKLIVTVKGTAHSRRSFMFLIYFDFDNYLKVDTIFYDRYKYSDSYNNAEYEFGKIITDKSSYFSDEKNILAFINLIYITHNELEQKKDSKSIKKKKIKKLTSKSIKAKINEIMDSKTFLYNMKDSSHYVLLTIKINKSNCIEIKVTFKKFQSTLQKLSELIDDLYNLYEQGIEVKHRRSSNLNNQSWNTPKGVNEDDKN